MKLSYLVTCSTETETLNRLLERLFKYKSNDDEIVVLLDSFAYDPTTVEIIEKYISGSDKNFLMFVENTVKNRNFEHFFDKRHMTFGDRVFTNNLNNDYGSHKNYGNSRCLGNFIFQIDGDELPSIELLENVKTIIESNSDVELIFIPRLNDFRGVTDSHAKQWGWKLTPSTSIIHEKIIDTNSTEYKFLKENEYILEESKID